MSGEGSRCRATLDWTRNFNSWRGRGKKSIRVEKGAVQMGPRASSTDVGVRWGSSLPSGKKGVEGVGV